jgi:glycosyltransferase involved in cell wall biosynthesis
MGRPRVSVVTPAFNREESLPHTVASVLDQSVGDLELLVVDDGSEIPVRKVLQEIRDPRLVVITHDSNRGAAAARNTALSAARAPLVAQLDSDDRWEAGYLEKVLPRFGADNVGLVYTDAHVTGCDGRERYIDDRSRHPVQGVSGLLPSCLIPSPTVTMRRTAVEAVGGYDTRFWSTQDWHLYLKLAHAGWHFDYVNAPLATYAWPDNPESISFHRRRVQREFVRLWLTFMREHPSTIPAHVVVLPMVMRGILRTASPSRAGC